MPSEKSKTNRKWTSSKKYREAYDKIFPKEEVDLNKEEPSKIKESGNGELDI